MENRIEYKQEIEKNEEHMEKKTTRLEVILF